MQAQMLAPAAILIAWTMIMLLWTAGTRLPAIKKAGRNIGDSKPGGRGQDLEGVLPDKVNWKAHNYAHLMEQPTIFYPAAIIIAIMGAGAGDVFAAWLYLGMRIIHSVYQASVNQVKVRFLIFVIATLPLGYLAIRVIYLTLFFDPGAAPL